MSSNVESTLAGFEREKFAARKRLYARLLLVCSLTEPSLRPSSWEGAAEVLLLPVAGALSDKLSRKSVIIGSLCLIALCRSSKLLLLLFNRRAPSLDALNVGFMACVGAVAKASYVETASSNKEALSASIDTATFSSLGLLLAPTLRISITQTRGGEKAITMVSALGALACAGAVVTMSDDLDDYEAKFDENDSLLAYTPLSLGRLAGANKDATLAIAASFLSNCAGTIVLNGFLEQIVSGISPKASMRLRFIIFSTLLTLAGMQISKKIQQILSIEEQSTIAGCANVGVALAILLRKPYIGLVLNLLAQRASDETDLLVDENRPSDIGRGEAVAAITNLATFSSLAGVLILNAANARAGPIGMFFAVGCMQALSEHFKRQLRQKKLEVW